MRKMALLLCAISISGNLALATPAFAEDPTEESAPGEQKMPTMTKEQRQKMAEAHENMATCLRSDRPMKECHEEMMKACKEHMGKNGCPFMRGKHKGHMKHPEESKMRSTK
jgi:hypothetical protein